MLQKIWEAVQQQIWTYDVQLFAVCILDSEAKAQCILSYSNHQTRSWNINVVIW